MPGPFVLQRSVHENVAELRRFLGSLTRALSFADLAELLNQRDSARRRNGATVQRWEKNGVEPDYTSSRVMAELAGVTFEEFALGAGQVAAIDRGELARKVAETSAKPYGAKLEPKDVPAPRGSGVVKKAPDKGRESA